MVFTLVLSSYTIRAFRAIHNPLAHSRLIYWFPSKAEPRLSPLSKGVSVLYGPVNPQEQFSCTDRYCLWDRDSWMVPRKRLLWNKRHSTQIIGNEQWSQIGHLAEENCASSGRNLSQECGSFPFVQKFDKYRRAVRIQAHWLITFGQRWLGIRWDGNDPSSFRHYNVPTLAQCCLSRCPSSKRLTLEDAQGPDTNCNADSANDSKGEVNPHWSLVIKVLLWGINDFYIGVNIFLIFVLAVGATLLLFDNRRDWRGWLLAILLVLNIARTSIGAEYDQHHPEYRQRFSHNGGNVSHEAI
jgi:hypothetical protein